MAINQAESKTNSPANEQFDYAQALQNSFLLNEVELTEASDSYSSIDQSDNVSSDYPSAEADEHICLSAMMGGSISDNDFEYYEFG